MTADAVRAAGGGSVNKGAKRMYDMMYSLEGKYNGNNTTRQLREPFVESAGLGITERGLQLLKDPIPTATYTGRQFVQDQSALEQQAATAAAGLDIVGPDAYKQFMSPYQQEVIDTSLAAMDREQAKGITSLRQRAAQVWCFWWW